MSHRELDAAHITDPALRSAYLRCRRLNARHGRTYFLATRLLPAARRPAVHALYGFARWADDIVDDVGESAAPAQRAAALDRLETRLRQALDGDPAAGEPVVLAVSDTAARYAIAPIHFTDFLASMRSDLTVGAYATYDDLYTYMHGSAAVIGLQILPVLGTVGPQAEAAPYAAALGVAFQLTNFLRDVGEDLDRGRVYVPEDLLTAHGVDRDLLHWSRSTGRRDRRITAALRAAEAMTRAVYRQAAPGLPLLDPVARPCIRAAYVLYGGILDAIADDGYPVLHRRAAVSRRRRAAVAADGLARLTAARLTARRPGGGATPAAPAGARPIPTATARPTVPED
ncbi:squalene/phytoene synthase family protein [Streptomyces sp. NPDC012510]|uniref:phytoene/squalene synthase family protein n=1 Tax=Streptomyces sp. NPDC012510 TaxID=3364838 RepID=UPI0036F015B6